MLATAASLAQGVVNADNNGTGVPIFIEDASGVIDGGDLVKIGTPAQAAGFAGAGPGQVAINLYAAPDSVAHGSMATILSGGTLLFSGFNVPSTLATFQGHVAPGSDFVLPTSAGFDGAQPVDFLFTARATVNGSLAYGVSSVGVIQPLSPHQAATGSLPPYIWGTGSGSGITGLVLTSDSLVASVPEPSTIVLGGLGMAAGLAFRRRK